MQPLVISSHMALVIFPCSPCSDGMFYWCILLLHVPTSLLPYDSTFLWYRKMIHICHYFVSMFVGHGSGFQSINISYISSIFHHTQRQRILPFMIFHVYILYFESYLNILRPICPFIKKLVHIIYSNKLGKCLWKQLKFVF